MGSTDTDHMKWKMNPKSQREGCALEDGKDQRNCEENLLAINRTATNAHRNKKTEQVAKGTNGNAQTGSAGGMHPMPRIDMKAHWTRASSGKQLGHPEHKWQQKTQGHYTQPHMQATQNA